MAGPDNMALDVALMSRARRTGETVLRVYGWLTPTLSLGRNQRAVGEYDDAAIELHGLDVVRRPTGGRALLHHREITYSVTAPADASPAKAYHRINLLLVNALGTMGVPAEIVPPGARASRPTATPCFAEPSAGELAVAGRKLAGSAQWRDAGAMLQHGSILLDDDQPLIARVMRRPAPAGTPPATLRELLGRVGSAGELAAHLLHAVRVDTDPDAGPMELEEAVVEEARRLVPHFRDPEWTWRR